MKQIKVLNYPATWIEISDEADEELERINWEKRYYRLRISDEQKRRELNNVREGKVMQRKYYK